ncbi:PAS domain-containing protein [Roseomonas sp. CAU 1739]|uniref:sensor histidine kinase n=1 Tax=Roseomonas sp. CAU 1739 TaxID=3140364 RepID=UPI00325B767B
MLIGGFGWEVERDAIDMRVSARAQAATRGIDAEIESRRLALESFAGAREGSQQGDLAATDAAARRLAATLDAQVSVLDRGLGLLVDTSQPFGTPLGSTRAVAEGLWAVETGQARVSNGPAGTTPAGPAPPPQLLVPVMHDGRATGVLAVSLSAERLAAAAGPRHSILFDNRWRVIASSGGTPADVPDWTVLAAAPRGVALDGRSGSGDTVRYVVTNLAAAPDWRLVTWESTAFVDSVVARLLPWVLICLAVAIATALFARARAMAALQLPVLALEHHARATAAALRDDAPRPHPPGLGMIDEFARLGAALGEADAAATASERRLRALAEAGAIVLWRGDAGGGWTEAAGWAGLTGQTAPTFRGDGWVDMLHPDDRAPTLAEWGRSLVARRPIGVEFRLRTADDAAGWRWVRATGVPVTDQAGQLQEWVGAIHDVADARGAGTARQVNDAQVRQTVAELRAVYDTVPVGLSLVDADLHFVNVNTRFAAIGGLPPEAHIGRAPHEVMPESLARPLEDAQRHVLQTGRPVLDVTCSGPAPGAVQQLRHWLASCHAVKDAEGTVTGVSAVLQDVTDRVRAERSREMLVTELNHRVKNTLATVQSLAAQSLRGARGGKEGLGREFVGRLQALMRAHDLLADLGWQEVDLARVVRTGLAPWIEGGRAIRMGGSGRIQVSAGQTQAIVMALHELASNAAHHGALSRPGGEVEVAWSLGDDGITVLDWHESGGPPVQAPSADRRGFGMRLLERGLAHDLGPGADVQMRFPQDGVTMAMRFRAGLPALQPVEG